MSIHILTAGPYEEIARRSLGVKWCFTERARREFVEVVERPVDPMSYYGPHSTIRCQGCNGIDTDVFPGWTRERDE